MIVPTLCVDMPPVTLRVSFAGLEISGVFSDAFPAKAGPTFLVHSRFDWMHAVLLVGPASAGKRPAQPLNLHRQTDPLREQARSHIIVDAAGSEPGSVTCGSELAHEEAIASTAFLTVGTPISRQAGPTSCAVSARFPDSFARLLPPLPRALPHVDCPFRLCHHALLT